MNTSKTKLTLLFILISTLTRVIPHPPNFSSIDAIMFTSLYVLKNRNLSLFTLLASSLMHDSIFGFHTTIPFVYLSIALSVLLAHKLHEEKSLWIKTIGLFSSPFLFFIISNAGVFFTTTIYPFTLEGLLLCYYAALPFLQNQLIIDACYLSLFYGAYQLYHYKFIFQELTPSFRTTNAEILLRS